MTVIDYLLLGGVAAAAIYSVYRLFLGWRNSIFRGTNEILKPATERVQISKLSNPNK